MSAVGWFEKLRHFIKVELKINAPLIDNSKTIVIDSSRGDNTGTPLVFDKDSQVITLNLALLTSNQKEKFAQTIQKYIEEDNRLLEVDTDELLEKLYKYNKEKTNQQIVEFFRQIIPPADLEALEASLYLRDSFKRHENVSGLKKDIRDVFGSRGNNIANLCTAGYFEQFLISLYNASSKERFLELYELIVGRTVLAVFVYRDMSFNEIKKEIAHKLAISRAYGIKFIHIHGIGESNVAKIKKCVEDEEFFKVFRKKVFEKENICIIELRPK